MNAEQTPSTAHETPLLSEPTHDLIDHGAKARNDQFQKIVETLSERRRPWFIRILAHGPKGCTADQLSMESGVPVNRISGRLTELRSQDRVIVRTSERRETRAGGRASVLVARVFLPDDGSRPMLPGEVFDESKETRFVPGGEIPDVHTNKEVWE